MMLYTTDIKLISFQSMITAKCLFLKFVWIKEAIFYFHLIWRIVVFIPSTMVLALCEMQTASFRNGIRVAESNSSDE